MKAIAITAVCMLLFESLAVNYLFLAGRLDPAILKGDVSVQAVNYVPVQQVVSGQQEQNYYQQ